MLSIRRDRQVLDVIGRRRRRHLLSERRIGETVKVLDGHGERMDGADVGSELNRGIVGQQRLGRFERIGPYNGDAEKVGMIEVIGCSSGESQTTLSAEPVEKLDVTTDGGEGLFAPIRRVLIAIREMESIEKERFVGRHTRIPDRLASGRLKS